ncbi:hypothetical protein C2S51_023220 [Perilla frutescens var. frutescens]|nr:hypothetical protein C2S51_023220 [Perilla frutescens var. frutescens]
MNFSCKSLRLYALFCCFCLYVYTANHNNITSISTLSVAENKFVLNLKADDYFKNKEKKNILEKGGGVRGARRLLLGGPGSSPPRCTSKCSGCVPCQPVHVPVPPGTRVTTEYYPEAWRCLWLLDAVMTHQQQLDTSAAASTKLAALKEPPPSIPDFLK